MSGVGRTGLRNIEPDPVVRDPHIESPEVRDDRHVHHPSVRMLPHVPERFLRDTERDGPRRVAPFAAGAIVQPVVDVGHARQILEENLDRGAQSLSVEDLGLELEHEMPQSVDRRLDRPRDLVHDLDLGLIREQAPETSALELDRAHRRDRVVVDVARDAPSLQLLGDEHPLIQPVVLGSEVDERVGRPGLVRCRLRWDPDHASSLHPRGARLVPYVIYRSPSRLLPTPPNGWESDLAPYLSRDGKT